MKKFAFILASILLIGAAASCEKSGSDKDGKSGGDSKNPSTKVEIKLTANFNADYFRYADFKVKYTEGGSTKTEDLTAPAENSRSNWTKTLAFTSEADVVFEVECTPKSVTYQTATKTVSGRTFEYVVFNTNAFVNFQSAAEKGHPEAMNNVALFYREGRVVEKNLKWSANLFEKSASYDNPYGQFNFALALQNGEGVAQDEARAAALLAQAADGGCLEAVDAYGMALLNGRGVPENAEAAFKYFLRAADAGYPPAMENLSKCYQYGKGVKADNRRAMEWKIRSCAARGDRNAQAWLQQNAKKK